MANQELKLENPTCVVIGADLKKLLGVKDKDKIDDKAMYVISVETLTYIDNPAAFIMEHLK